MLRSPCRLAVAKLLSNSLQLCAGTGDLQTQHLRMLLGLDAGDPMF